MSVPSLSEIHSSWQEKDVGAVTTSLEHDFKHLALKLDQGIPIKAVPSNNSPCKIMLLNVSAP